MATYIKRANGRVRAQIRRKGVSESQDFDSLRDAKAWAIPREAEIIARTRGQIVGGRTVKEALREYAAKVSPTHRGSRWEVIRLTAFESLLPFSNRPVDAIRPADVALWRDRRLTEVSTSTVKRELGLLSAVFEVARIEWHWVAVNPVKDVRKPADAPHRERTVTPREWRALFEASAWRPGKTPTTRTALAVAAFALSTRTAMRAGEILSLQAVDTKRRVAHLPMTKNGRSRDVPLSPQALRILAGLKLPLPLSSWQLDALFRRARSIAGIEGLHFHDARHSATTMLAKKLSVMELARVTGHSDTRQLMKYFNPSVDSLADKLTARSPTR